MKLFKSNNQLVAEIHHEFDSAEDKLLAEAERIIASLPDEEKAIRLISTGFTKTEAVKQFIKKGMTKEHADLIRHYKQNYPFQKFITEDELNRICKKYNLIYAPVGSYTKDVPEKNLTDVENVPDLKISDRPVDIRKCKLVLENFIFPDRLFLNFFFRLWWTLPRIIDGHYSSSYAVNDYFTDNFQTGGFKYLCSRIKNITILRQGLFIAAPESHFDLSGLHKEGLLHSTFSVIVPKDPIVFRYVRGGIQIITKWGLEAEEKKLLNEIEN